MIILHLLFHNKSHFEFYVVRLIYFTYLFYTRRYLSTVINRSPCLPDFRNESASNRFHRHQCFVEYDDSTTIFVSVSERETRQCPFELVYSFSELTSVERRLDKHRGHYTVESYSLLGRIGLDMSFRWLRSVQTLDVDVGRKSRSDTVSNTTPFTDCTA